MPAPNGVYSTESLVEAVADFPARHGTASVFFPATGTALMSVTIGGVVFQEAAAAVVASGIWTNGASAADSATSLAAAINGDTRAASANLFDAIVTASGGGVVVRANDAGLLTTTSTPTITISQTGNAVVENFHSSQALRSHRMVAGIHTVTAQDVNADELSFALPEGWTATNCIPIVNYVTSTGLIAAWTTLATIQTLPNRLRVLFAGGTDPVAGDIIRYIVIRIA